MTVLPPDHLVKELTLLLFIVGSLVWYNAALVIVPFEAVLSGENLTITCYTINGFGAAAVRVVNENSIPYSLVNMLDPANVTMARFNYGPVSTADNGKRFICEDTGDSSRSSQEVLVVIPADTVVFNPGPVNTTVVEGQTAVLTCKPQVNRVLGIAIWFLAPPGSNFARVFRRNTTVYPGVDAVFFSKDYTRLFLVGVQRRFNGATIMCDGTNEVAQIPSVSATPVFLMVLDLPDAPRMLVLFNLSPFSTQLKWDPPANENVFPNPLNYTVTLTNITDGTVLQYTLPSTQITLSNLLPGVQYNVSVYAKYSMASGPPVTGVFRTNNSVPIIQEIGFTDVSQFTLAVRVVLVSNGGRPILNCHVTFNGRTATYPCTFDAMGNETTLELSGKMLRHGEVFPLSVQVENDLGNSTRMDTSIYYYNNSMCAQTEESAASRMVLAIVSTFVVLLGVIILAVIIAALIAGVCVWHGRKTRARGITEGSCPTDECPARKEYVCKQKPEEQETSVHPMCQPNPCYEPLAAEVPYENMDLEGSHKNPSEEEADSNKIPVLQANPSYEPMLFGRVVEPEDSLKKLSEEQVPSVDHTYKPKL